MVGSSGGGITLAVMAATVRYGCQRRWPHSGTFAVIWSAVKETGRVVSLVGGGLALQRVRGGLFRELRIRRRLSLTRAKLKVRSCFAVSVVSFVLNDSGCRFRRASFRISDRSAGRAQESVLQILPRSRFHVDLGCRQLMRHSISAAREDSLLGGVVSSAQRLEGPSPVNPCDGTSTGVFPLPLLDVPQKVRSRRLACCARALNWMNGSDSSSIAAAGGYL